MFQESARRLTLGKQVAQILYPFADWYLLPVEGRSRNHGELPVAGLTLIHLHTVCRQSGLLFITGSAQPATRRALAVEKLGFLSFC